MRNARAMIARSGGPHTVVFDVLEEPWDAIRASPEEQAQAALP
jgi:hypothetical protein